VSDLKSGNVNTTLNEESSIIQKYEIFQIPIENLNPLSMPIALKEIGMEVGI
jgi:hypothetical protein